jgi:hypothetical protein
MLASEKMGSSKRYQDVAASKAGGETYTPQELSEFVATQICNRFQATSKDVLKVLDPSIGDGALSLALIKELKETYSGNIELFAFDTNANALAIAQSRFEKAFPECTLHFSNQDFLQFVISADKEPDLLSLSSAAKKPIFDLIIANPPYVRTQIIGADAAQVLARAFGLAGRVDLYQAFLLAMAKVLAPDGAAGFIISNRFMTTKGGGTLRTKLRQMLTLREVWDLGDTKLFDAAVLPAVIVANGLGTSDDDKSISFTSIYETQDQATAKAPTPIQALEHEGVVEISDGRRFQVKSGALDGSADIDGVWRVATATGDAWLSTVQQHTAKTFGDVGKIRVGVKTCADKIFIRHDWEDVTNGDIPELLRILTTHHGAGRFRATAPKKARYILYPQTVVDGQRQASDLNLYPKSKAYLEANRVALEARTYVTDGGRKWYEIWVPQDPAVWPLAKLVFRDISEGPTFWMDLEGTVVNGDCYWMTCANEGQVDILWLALAVANSTFIEKFYDHCFNNKLYAGRRRFITQYVEKFPLPKTDSPLSKSIIAMAKLIYQDNHSSSSIRMEEELDYLVWKSFGLEKEFTR